MRCTPAYILSSISCINDDGGIARARVTRSSVGRSNKSLRGAFESPGVSVVALVIEERRPIESFDLPTVYTRIYVPSHLDSRIRMRVRARTLLQFAGEERDCALRRVKFLRRSIDRARAASSARL